MTIAQTTEDGASGKPVTGQLLSKEQYDNFRRFLEQSCGIVLGDNKHYLVTSRLNRLTQEFAFPSLGAMLEALKNDNARGLKERVIDAMTTNETSWFRDLYPYTLLQNHLLPELAKRALPRIRIWSAACSSGQEPYSINMVIQEFQMQRPGMLSAPVEIVGTDISTSVLEAARKGVYDELSLGRGVSEERRKRFFRQAPDGRWEIDPKLKANVRFSELNLLQSYALFGKFDLIFCRNVLIYFSSDSKRDILDRMAQILNPGGYLILGGSESPTGYSRRFEMTRYPEGVIYRLRDGA